MNLFLLDLFLIVMTCTPQPWIRKTCFSSTYIQVRTQIYIKEIYSYVHVRKYILFVEEDDELLEKGRDKKSVLPWCFQKLDNFLFSLRF